LQVDYSVLDTRSAPKVKSNRMKNFHNSARKLFIKANLSPSFASYLITSRGFPEYVPPKKGNFSFLRVLYGPLPTHPLDFPPSIASQAGLPEGRPTCFLPSYYFLVDPANRIVAMPRTHLPKTTAQDNIQVLDELFHQAGLVRSRSGKTAGVSRANRLDGEAPEELHRPAPTPRKSENGAVWIPVAAWDRYPWLWHGFSTRKGGLSRAYCGDDSAGELGELNLGFTSEDERETVLSNRRLLVEAVTGDATTPLVPIRQFHSNLVVRVTSTDAAREKPWKADGRITNEHGLLLAVQTADCIPVLVADRKRRAVGAFHAGWRGTVKRIVETGIGRMRLEFDSRPEDLIAAIGPGVGSCCYAVGEEVLSEFESQFLYARELFHEVYSADVVRQKYPMLFLTQRAPGHSPIGPSLHLDLIEANRRQLLDAGLKPGAIKIVGGCTNCDSELFFSHRGSRGRTGRMMAVIGIRDPRNVRL
jgi:YfiH family protein